MGPIPLELLDEQLETCDKCPLCTIPINPIEFALQQYPLDLKLMVIALNPSPEEHLTQTPWFDRHHKYVKNLVAPIFPLNNVYFTYLVKCSTANTIGVKNSKTCKETYLLREIELLQPKVVLSLGTVVSKILMKTPLRPGDFYQYPNTDQLWANWHSAHSIFNGDKYSGQRFTQFLQILKQKL